MTIEEVVEKGRIPIRYWTTFSGVPVSSPLTIEHVYPGTYAVKLLRRAGPVFPNWCVAGSAR